MELWIFDGEGKWMMRTVWYTALGGGTDTGLDVGVAFARQLVGVGDIRRAQMYGTLHPEQMYIVSYTGIRRRIFFRLISDSVCRIHLTVFCMG